MSQCFGFVFWIFALQTLVSVPTVCTYHNVEAFVAFSVSLAWYHPLHPYGFSVINLLRFP